MDEKLLLKFALFFACIGATSLLFILYFYEIEPVAIFDAKSSGEDNFVKINGMVESVVVGNSSTKIVISSVEKIDVVIFDKIQLTKGDLVVVEGKTEYYLDSFKIIADSIVHK